MADHELNKAMAKLCGIEVVDHPLDSHGLPYMVDFGLEGEGFAMMVDVGGKAVKVVWNPVDNWQQAHEFVIAALQERDCDVTLLYGRGPTEIEIELRGRQRTDANEWCVVGNSTEPKPSPRFVCKAALEAWEDLEATA